VDLQQETLLQVRFAGTGNRLRLEPLITEVQVEPKGGTHLAGQWFWFLQVIQKGLATKYLEMKVSTGHVNVH
jgi:hypothetical protein